MGPWGILCSLEMTLMFLIMQRVPVNVRQIRAKNLLCMGKIQYIFPRLLPNNMNLIKLAAVSYLSYKQVENIALWMYFCIFLISAHSRAIVIFCTVITLMILQLYRLCCRNSLVNLTSNWLLFSYCHSNIRSPKYHVMVSTEILTVCNIIWLWIKKSI